MATVAARWQKLSKERRAAVYRAIGRAARVAREDRDTALTGDLRIVMDVLRGLAASRPKPKPKPKPRTR
jgi:hypothetical protein